MNPDADFNNIAEAFEGDIYGSSKGFIRLKVLWEDLLAGIPELSAGGLTVLDAGGGSGHVTVRLAQAGNEVVLCDPSREMLDRAEAAIARAGVGDAISVVEADISQLASAVDRPFDVVICHAVLEWVADPRGALARLSSFVKKHGYLSLMFYNQNAALLKRVLAGEFAMALREHADGPLPRGWGPGAKALAEAEVRRWLTEVGLVVLSKAGVRIFHDHLPESARLPEKLDELLAVERALRREEPFASLGQHIHLVCSRV